MLFSVALPPNLPEFVVGLFLVPLGVYLALHPGKLGRIGFGTAGGAVPKEVPPLPRWVAWFIAANLLCIGIGLLTVAVWSPSHSHSAGALLTFGAAFLFFVTMALTAIVAGLSARQRPGFTRQTASRVRGYRITAFVYAAIALAILFLIFVLPFLHHS
jgi:hypothetical protein